MKYKILILIMGMIGAMISTTVSAEGNYVSLKLGLGLPSDSNYTSSGWAPGVGRISVENTLEFENSKSISVILGRRMSPNLRMELEFSYKSSNGAISTDEFAIEDEYENLIPSGITLGDIDIGIKSQFAMINGYYDFTNESKFTPYLSAGLGMGWHKATINEQMVSSSYNNDNILTNVSEVNGRDHAFAYQLGFGGSYEVVDSTYLTTGYRYIGSAVLNFNESSADVDLGIHEINAGIRMEF